MTLDTGVAALLAGRYRLEKRIAVGGMGEVWRALDTLLDRPVAVKVLRPEFVGDAGFRARFRAEARHAARLSHPGIASVYDFGEMEDAAWLVMELVDGEPLSTLLRREGVLPVDRVLDVVAQTAAALQAAHDGGVVHHDVKPGNLLVRPDGVVKVTDFGIASASGAVPLTQTGQLVGTALYVSPEQAAGRAAGPASDLYALGVVAFECLAGHRPFTGEHPLAVVLGHLNDPPPALPAGVPAPVAELVQRLLAKDPDERPDHAHELAATATALRAGLSGGPQGTPEPLLPVEPPAAVRDAGDSDDGDALEATGLLPTPVPAAAASAPPGSTPRSQRRAVRAIAVLLGLLALGLGLRSAGTDTGAPAAPVTTTVPAVLAGASEGEVMIALMRADLTATRARESSASVPAGRVVGVRPPAGTELAPGTEVTVVVSAGRPPVQVSAASLLGRPAAEVRDELRALGLVPRLAYDGEGAAVGTVAAVEPVGAVPVGREVVLHVVPAPPAPVRSEPVQQAPAPAEDESKGKGAKGKGKGK